VACSAQASNPWSGSVELRVIEGGRIDHSRPRHISAVLDDFLPMIAPATSLRLVERPAAIYLYGSDPEAA